MGGFLTNTVVVESEIKDTPEIKNKTIINKIKEPKAPRKTNIFRALLIGLLLLALLAGAFLVYDKYQKGELKLDNLNLPFLEKKQTDANATMPLRDINADKNRNINQQDTNTDRNNSN
jgi:uncharacterized protein YneF (UPF0154 family)